LGIAEKFIATSEEYNNLSGRDRSTYGLNCQPLKINRFQPKPLTLHKPQSSSGGRRGDRKLCTASDSIALIPRAMAMLCWACSGEK
jgi:hypothetical protein